MKNLAGTDGLESLRTSYNLARHGVFHDAPAWSPGTGPYMRREPGHPVFIMLVLATVPSFPEVPLDCTLDPLCAPGEPLRERYRQAEMAMVAMAVGAVFLATLALTRRWTLALVAGTTALFLITSNVTGTALTGILLLAHAVLAWRMWKRPRAATGALAGLALGLAVLVEAVLQYWLLVLAALCAAGLWREAGRRRLLTRAVAAMLLAAFLPTGLWMVRNHIVVGQFAVSGRGGEILAIRAEYAQATWPEIRGMLAYRLPKWPIWKGLVLERLAMDWLRPEVFGYARMGDNMSGTPNLAGFYPRAKFAFLRPMSAKGSHSVVAKRADFLAPGWRKKPWYERNLIFQRASLQLIRENWLKHLAVSVPVAFRGMSHHCRRYLGLHAAFGVMRKVDKGMCAASRVLGLIFVPATLVMFILATRRRDTALALLVLPAVYFFFFHALVTHFHPRLAQPVLPLLMVVAALAANECLHWRTARVRGPQVLNRVSKRRPAGGRMEAGPTPNATAGIRNPRALP